MTKLAGVLFAFSGIVSAQQFRFEHTPGNHWVLSNGLIEASFVLTHDSKFEFEYIKHLKNGDVWTTYNGVSSSPIRFATTNTAVDAYIPVRFVAESTQPIDRKGMRQNLTFDELGGGFRILLALEMFEDQPVLRYSVKVKNLRDTVRRVSMADMLSWNFSEPRNTFQMMHVNQWNVAPPLKNFEVLETTLAGDSTPELVRSGSGGTDCAWIALRDSRNRGLFAGWEFDGRAEASGRYTADNGRLQISAFINDLNRLLSPNDEFQVPAGFIGLYHGDWDEAGFRTQRFVESVLAKPLPDPVKFPYVVYDSWGYETDINEEIMRLNAQKAAKLGMELFIVDLGWARNIGDWREDPTKFPSRLKDLSNYVHSLGMKFGLHIAPAEVAENAPVLKDHPDWLSTETNSYFGAKSICLSHKPAQEWIVQEIIRMIDEYGVDWVLQDGEHIVKTCNRRDHTHDPDDSNYSNAVEGLNAVLDAVQKARPNASWENCADGGSMMTFNMVKYYVTSITNDASGARGSRQAVYGATYPFPPRYTDRYMPEDPTGPYFTRSYMFGGPWIFMNKLIEMTPAEENFAASEVKAYKAMRGPLRDSKVFHLTGQPDEGRYDAIQGFNASLDSAVAVVTRDSGPGNVFVAKFQGLNGNQNYRVRFQDDRRIFLMTGDQLMTDGVQVVFGSDLGAEIVYVERADSGDVRDN